MSFDCSSLSIRSCVEDQMHREGMGGLCHRPHCHSEILDRFRTVRPVTEAQRSGTVQITLLMND